MPISEIAARQINKALALEDKLNASLSLQARAAVEMPEMEAVRLAAETAFHNILGKEE